MSQYMIEMCREFYNDTTRNPSTGRAIAHDGPTYIHLMDLCKRNGIGREQQQQQHQQQQQQQHEQQQQRQDDKNEKPKQVAIFVLGLGCAGEKETNMNELKREFQKKSSMEVEIICNKSTLAGLASCYTIPSKTSPVIQNIYKKTQTYLNQGYEVYLIGHGYGGMCCTRVAEIWNVQSQQSQQSQQHVQRLHIATMGSIYISKDTSRTDKIDIQHYMFAKDVAMKCNKLKENSNLVTWMDHAERKQKASFFGTGEKWSLRNSYHELTLQILKNKSVVYAKKSGLLTIEALKRYYVSTLENKLKKGETVNKAFILLNFHPDKLSLDLKAQISNDLENNDKQSNVYSSRVFSEIKAKSSLTMSELERILAATTGGGVRPLRPNGLASLQTRT